MFAHNALLPQVLTIYRGRCFFSLLCRSYIQYSSNTPVLQNERVLNLEKMVSEALLGVEKV